MSAEQHGCITPEGLKCNYGDEYECCGEKFSEFTMECLNNKWSTSLNFDFCIHTAAGNHHFLFQFPRYINISGGTCPPPLAGRFLDKTNWKIELNYFRFKVRIGIGML